MASWRFRHIGAPSTDNSNKYFVISRDNEPPSAGGAGGGAGGGAEGGAEGGAGGGAGGGANDAEVKWKVGSGNCFLGFSYSLDPRNSLKIDGLESGFTTQPGEKIYLEFDISPYLQVIGGRVNHSKIGKDSPDFESTELNAGTWADFPNMFRIMPKDEVDENGFVTKRAEGKRQTKAYILLGVRSDDDLSDLIDEKKASEDTKKQNDSQQKPDASKNYTFSQKFSSNIIMMISQVSGTPIVFPMPWLDSLK